MEFYRSEYKRRCRKLGVDHYISTFYETLICKRREQILSDIYYEYKYQIKMSFYEFKTTILHNWDTYEKRIVGKWSFPVIRGRRVKAKRTKQYKRSYKKKKRLSNHEQNKRAWREYKKIKKDKSKRHGHFSYDEYIRDHNNRALRRWVKQRLSQGDYSLEKKYKRYKHFATEWKW